VDKTGYDISILLPFLNEEENIPHVVAALHDFLHSLKDIKTEVIFIDDGSTDNSVNVLLNEIKSKPLNSKLIKLSRNYGSHAALRAGIMHAGGKHITFYYADLQDPVKLVSDLYEKCKDQYDIVWAYRESGHSSFFTKIFSDLYAYLMRKYAISNFPRYGIDIVMFNEKVKDQLNNNIESNSSVFLQILNFGFHQGNITYKRGKRKMGKTKWTFSKKLKLFIDSFIAFSYAPIRFISVIGILLFVMGFAWTIYILLRTLIYDDLATGWPSLISILMIGFGITNISLSIIAEYLWRTLDSSRKRPVFIIDEILNL